MDISVLSVASTHLSSLQADSSPSQNCLCSRRGRTLLREKESALREASLLLCAAAASLFTSQRRIMRTTTTDRMQQQEQQQQKQPPECSARWRSPPPGASELPL